nr:AmmeMemoRadiSam system radical SAM enzyme [Butyrivibrio sp. FCS014]
MPKCDVCHNECNLEEGVVGLCRARKYENGGFKCVNYGLVTSIALDPIEKKPLNRFFPGSNIISVGSFGCNLRCPFCQNHEISYGFGQEYNMGYRYISAEELADIAKEYSDRGNIGVAFTYNEPLIGYEYVIDASKEVHKAGMKTVLVSNGCVSERVRDLVLPHIDAMNIDLKGFTDAYYSDVLRGNRRLVMSFIEAAAAICHVEVTTLVVPGFNDSEREMEQIASWLAGLNRGRGKENVALHISRYFPRFKMDVPATDVRLVYRLADVARKHLDYVYEGNC